MFPRRWQGFALAALSGVALAPTSARAQAPVCGAWEIDYALAENLRLSDTPMGKGDGVYPVGPGRVVLRFDDVDGQPGGHVEMVSYAMLEQFTIESRALFWGARVVTDSHTRAATEACGAAEGALQGSTLTWTTPVRGYRTDGTVSCDGSLCGKFGAPPPGKSELHIGPGPIPFRPFELARDLKSFTMAETFVARTEMPKQTAHVSLAGQQTRRVCVPAATCH